MSLPRPPNRKPFFGPTLIGACTGMILCIPLAAYTAAALGDDYNTRALIYCGFLLWCIVGAVVLFMKTWQSETRRSRLRDACSGAPLSGSGLFCCCRDSSGSAAEPALKQKGMPSKGTPFLFVFKEALVL